MRSNRRSLVLFVSLCLAASPASAARFGGAASLPLIDHLAEWLGFEALSGADRDALAIGAGIFAIVFGYLTHLAFAEHGFGRIGNALVGMTGAGLCFSFGAPYWRSLPTAMQFNAALMLCGCASAILLVFCAMLKELGLRCQMRFWNHLTRRNRRQPPVEPELLPRVAAILRKPSN